MTTDQTSPAAHVDAVEVFWRPGCPFCSVLLGTLKRERIAVELHNIWEDDDARAFVRAANDGNETVPTVVLAGTVATNPPPAALVAEVRARYPHLVSAT